MTWQIRSHIEYFIHTCIILFLILWSKIYEDKSLLTVFNTIQLWFTIVAYFFSGPPCILWLDLACCRCTFREFCRRSRQVELRSCHTRLQLAASFLQYLQSSSEQLPRLPVSRSTREVISSVNQSFTVHSLGATNTVNSPTPEVLISRVFQIKSNQIYLPAQIQKTRHNV